jgi:hypothetical protein
MFFKKSTLAQPHHEMPGPAAKMPGPAFAHFYHRIDHFLYRPHAVEVGEISTGLRLTSRLYHKNPRTIIAGLKEVLPGGARTRGWRQRSAGQIKAISSTRLVQGTENKKNAYNYNFFSLKR